jgi:hypothetical protein
MKLRAEQPFYFMATIYRGNVQVIRQGTINAESAQEAVDRVYEMGRVTWKRAVVKVVILTPHDGEVLYTSTLEQRFKELDEKSKPENKESKKEKSGFVPWDKPVGSQFWPSQIGSYFRPKQFKTLP